jgi:hypothetical protein
VLNSLNNNINIKVICLQEVWQVPFPDLIAIPGFTFVSKQRNNSRGGGVGFYVKNDVKYKILTNLSPFTDKLFESITIEVTLNNKKVIVCNYYRSPSPIANMSNSVQLSEFVDIIDNLSFSLSNLHLPVYITSDTNLNLLNFANYEYSESYLHSLHSNGFLLTNFKATRMHNDSNSLIDHIFSNNVNSQTVTGSIVSDISDHFINFIQIPFPKYKKIINNKTSRKFTADNIASFKDSLRTQNWNDVLSTEDTNNSCNNFWETFKSLFNIHFPLTTVKGNRNTVKMNDFMTKGLLISRSTKNKLHKKHLINPSPENTRSYKTYRNIYNTLIRKSRKLFYLHKLNIHKRNPKKNMGHT